MKTYIKNIFQFTLILTCLASCSSDYLDTYPTDSVSPSTTFETVAGAEGAINGLAKLMVSQYTDDYGQSFNGEGTIKLFYGDYPGNDFARPYVSTWQFSLMNMEYLEQNNTRYNNYPWHYYYRIIFNANMIIEQADGIGDATPSQINFIKAQALTYRAYSYSQLIQLYAKRWKDYQGETPGVVLQLSSSYEELPLSTSKEVYAQIYADLDEAIGLYEASEEDRDDKFAPNINVAYATYARTALSREDYQTALEMAGLARSGYPLMSNAEYTAGFVYPTDEWIWYSYGASDETLYYYSYQSYFSYNANSSASRNNRCSMSIELYNLIPDSDIRKALFLNPEVWADQDLTTAEYDNDYFSQDWDITDENNVNQSNYKLEDDDFIAEVKAYQAAMFEYEIPSSSSVGLYEHYKVGAIDAPGVGNTVHFRSSEMALIEAECNYQLANEAAAQASLEELTAATGRDANYTCTSTGDALFSEIQFYRRIELWGEGFNWFDYKRWGLPIDRKSIAEGGNFHETMATSAEPEDHNEWTWLIPLAESDYNEFID